MSCVFANIVLSILAKGPLLLKILLVRPKSLGCSLGDRLLNFLSEG
jgi:hypothetical protein